MSVDSSSWRTIFAAIICPAYVNEWKARPAPIVSRSNVGNSPVLGALEQVQSSLQALAAQAKQARQDIHQIRCLIMMYVDRLGAVCSTMDTTAKLDALSQLSALTKPLTTHLATQANMTYTKELTGMGEGVQLLLQALKRTEADAQRWTSRLEGRRLVITAAEQKLQAVLRLLDKQAAGKLEEHNAQTKKIELIRGKLAAAFNDIMNGVCEETAGT